MRQIKFKAWDEKGEYFKPLEDDGDYYYRDDGDGLRLWDKWGECENIVLLQQSGFKDKNENDIWEGDLVRVERTSDEIIVECKFGTIQRQMSTGFLVDITGFYFEREDGTQTFPIISNHKGVHDTMVFEVIGNIYETPSIKKK